MKYGEKNYDLKRFGCAVQETLGIARHNTTK